MNLNDRLQELRDDEQRRAPSFDRVLMPRSIHRPVRLAWATGVLAACIVSAALMWMRPHEQPAQLTVLFDDEVWTTPTDSLLADGGDAEIDSLTRDINQLLKP